MTATPRKLPLCDTLTHRNTQTHTNISRLDVQHAGGSRGGIVRAHRASHMQSGKLWATLGCGACVAELAHARSESPDSHIGIQRQRSEFRGAFGESGMGENFPREKQIITNIQFNSNLKSSNIIKLPTIVWHSNKIVHTNDYV